MDAMNSRYRQQHAWFVFSMLYQSQRVRVMSNFWCFPFFDNEMKE